MKITITCQKCRREFEMDFIPDPDGIITEKFARLTAICNRHVRADQQPKPAPPVRTQHFPTRTHEPPPSSSKNLDAWCSRSRSHHARRRNPSG